MKMGIAFKGFKEKTEQSKAEARRRGDAGVSDEDEDDNKSKKKKAGKPVDRSAAWKKGSGGGSAGGKRKSRPGKVEHKSYEQILQEAGADGTGQQQQAQVIIDATGAGGPREISSLAEMASWTPSADMRIPEVRHNLRLIVDMSKGELDGLAKEARTVQERRKWIEREDVRLRKKMAEEAQRAFTFHDHVANCTDPLLQLSRACRTYISSSTLFTPRLNRLALRTNRTLSPSLSTSPASALSSPKSSLRTALTPSSSQPFLQRCGASLRRGSLFKTQSRRH